jgi:hypothetical protein
MKSKQTTSTVRIAENQTRIAFFGCSAPIAHFVRIFQMADVISLISSKGEVGASPLPLLSWGWQLHR